MKLLERNGLPKTADWLINEFPAIGGWLDKLSDGSFTQYARQIVAIANRFTEREFRTASVQEINGLLRSKGVAQRKYMQRIIDLAGSDLVQRGIWDARHAGALGMKARAALGLRTASDRRKSRKSGRPPIERDIGAWLALCPSLAAWRNKASPRAREDVERILHRIELGIGVRAFARASGPAARRGLERAGCRLRTERGRPDWRVSTIARILISDGVWPEKRSRDVGLEDFANLRSARAGTRIGKTKIRK